MSVHQEAFDELAEPQSIPAIGYPELLRTFGKMGFSPSAAPPGRSP